MVKLKVQLRRLTVREVYLDYPFIGLEQWGRYLLEHKSKYVLGGHRIGKDSARYTEMYNRFWGRYKVLDPRHIMFSTFTDFGRIIPYLIHGDEGRGKSKNPILITSFQFLFSVHGERQTNMKGHPGWNFDLFNLRIYIYIYFYMSPFLSSRKQLGALFWSASQLLQ